MLTVLSVGYPFAPVTADPVGGAEQVLAALDRALVDAGHRSLVIAPEGSEVAGELIPVPAVQGEIDDEARAPTYALVAAAISIALRGERIDAVHFHGLDFPAYLPPPGTPALATLHLPLGWYAPGALRGDVALVPVSDDQARRAPAGVALQTPIPNGVDLHLYRPGGPKGDYALILGRVAPEKGFADAFEAARLAGAPLRAAGQLYPYAEHRRYFETEVAPRVGGDRSWLGPVVGSPKRALLAEARCLLVPSTAPETSSLVAMEALASGTPVIAYPSGALPDIVEDGVTGFLVDGVDAMADAIGHVDAIDPAACRRSAEARFDLRRTIAAYLHLYAQLAR